jgi:hypothetical protein
LSSRPAQEIHEVLDLGLAMRRQGFELLDEAVYITGVHRDFPTSSRLGNKGIDGSHGQSHSRPRALPNVSVPFACVNPAVPMYEQQPLTIWNAIRMGLLAVVLVGIAAGLVWYSFSGPIIKSRNNRR